MKVIWKEKTQWRALYGCVCLLFTVCLMLFMLCWVWKINNGIVIVMIGLTPHGLCKFASVFPSKTVLRSSKLAPYVCEKHARYFCLFKINNPVSFYEKKKKCFPLMFDHHNISIFPSKLQIKTPWFIRFIERERKKNLFLK